MFSYEQRLKTFLDRKWPSQGFKSTPHLLAICGYICKSTSCDLAAQCVYCKKTLEGWEKDDIPVIEHFSHKKECILFSPNNKKAFFAHDLENVHLSKLGFVRYDLKEGIPFIFCYKCGSTNISHKCKVTKRFKLDLENPSEFFFINLIRGDYKDFIDAYISKNLFLPSDLKSLFKVIFDNDIENNPLKSLEDYLSEFINAKLNEVEEIFDLDIQNYLNEKS